MERWQVQPIFPLGRSRETAKLQLSAEFYLQFGRFVAGRRNGAKTTGVRLLPGDTFFNLSPDQSYNDYCPKRFGELDLRFNPLNGLFSDIRVRIGE